MDYNEIKDCSWDEDGKKKNSCTKFQLKREKFCREARRHTWWCRR